jgi:Phage integrase, N-terminal SAM-like domain
MSQLYFTDLAALRRPAIVDGVTQELLVQAAAATEATGLSDGMPFILDECGGYDVDLNRIFRSCPTMGVRSSNSLRAYARDLLAWIRFLSERRGSKPIWQADREDVAAYRGARRRSAPVHRISAATWNRAVAALEKFYVWAVEES